ncbi:RTA1-domain-containing protein [Mycena venus]|uniref:RTA1-domain-containing protein n=1 Tax=Mycena venus TaxID=2733690 RepID=A0A8H6YUZ9_9AGAR|nr:RTA1-domain-containing protein [Mycena venus]
MSSITPSGPTFIPPSQYGYTPHEYVAVIFLVVFGMSTILHIGQATYYRMWWLFPTVCLCGVGELIGWGGRLWSSFSPDLHKPFMMQIVSLVVSPTPLIAVNFVLLSWIVIQLGPRYSWLSPRWYTVIFLSSDIIALLVQAAGGSIAAAASDHTRAQVGAHTMLGGILFQFVAMITYCCLAGDFLVRYTSDRPVKLNSSPSIRGVLLPGTKRMIYALAFSTLVLFIRSSIYRIIELATGWHSSFMLNELYFNVLDGGMVALAIVVINLEHPGRLIGPRRPEAPTEYGYGMKMKVGRGQSEEDGLV